jgi:hypothetical protein
MTEATLLDAFATPPKVSAATSAMKKLRNKYISDISTQYGIPEGMARTIVYTYKTLPKMHEISKKWTGRCAISGVILTERGNDPTSAVIQHKSARFLSKFIADSMAALHLPEATFIRMCSAVHTAASKQKHYGDNTAVQQPSLGVQYHGGQSANPSRTNYSSEPTRPTDAERSHVPGVY